MGGNPLTGLANGRLLTDRMAMALFMRKGASA